MIRVRFAPSPTGKLHIGSARTAIFNWLFARSKGGKFILRIEDTDIQRSQKEYLDEILDSLTWLGLNWDEEYHQSQRLEIYREYARKLLDKGLAYEEKSEKGTALIYKVPEQADIKIKDLIYGDINFNAAEIKDQVLIKSDGTPAYNFACVVDDYLMKISHIIRGEDHISNTPKQIMLYGALGFKMPQFAHLPLILAKGGGRLSKRTGATAISEYQDMGILSAAIFNYLLLLGWSPGHNKEIVQPDEAIKAFKLEAVNHTAATFDLDKLMWVNNQYFKSADTREILELLLPRLQNAGFIDENTDRDWLKDLVKLLQPRLSTLEDFLKWADFFFVEKINFDAAAVDKLKQRDCSEDFRNLESRFSKLEEFNAQNIEKEFRDYIAERGIKSRDLIHPLRAALTGKTIGPGLFEAVALLGKEKVKKRLQSAANP